MNAANPRVSVVVPTRDRPDLLAGCLAALEEQTWQDLEVVVVDDGSADPDAVAAVVSPVSRARLVVGQGSGPAAARNLGADNATGSVIAFTDDDCRPAPGWLDAVTRRIDDGAQVVAGPTRNGRPDDACATASQTITNHLTHSTFDTCTGQVRFAPTSNIACRSDLHAIHRFDESFPLAAGEDRAWCATLEAAGVAAVFEPEAWVSHHQDLSLRRYWRQQFRYGRGAHRLGRRTVDRRRLQPWTFYVALLRRGFAQGPIVGGLVVLAQVATAMGVMTDAVAERRRG